MLEPRRAGAGLYAPATMAARRRACRLCVAPLRDGVLRVLRVLCVLHYLRYLRYLRVLRVLRVHAARAARALCSGNRGVARQYKAIARPR